MIRNCSRLFSSAALAARQESPQWDIFVATAICRLPIIAPEMNEIQKKYVKMQSEIEEATSYKSDFELREAKDRKLLEQRKQLEAEGKDLSSLEGEIGVTAMMEEEEWSKRKLTAYESFGISEHAFEEPENLKTLSRAFDKKLLLLIRQKFTDTGSNYSSPWILPQMKNNGEPLRQTVEQCLGEIFKGNVKLSIYGNAPKLHLTYKYPKKLTKHLKTDAVGGKVFVYQCFVDEITKNPNFNDKLISEFRWCTTDEAVSVLDTKNMYRKVVKHLLFE
uniref:Large ribosomal subunit protein mL46 n=1 Tax=Panagrolaimus sp. JU765 TaxID=591449 RepID=A0AC34Q5H1_9BILA